MSVATRHGRLSPHNACARWTKACAAAAVGHTTLLVARQPVVAIVPTGDEIRPVGTPLEQGDIVDSNSVLLAAAVIFELFGVPVLAALHGGRPVPGLGDAQLAMLDCGRTSAPDVEEWIPVTLTAGPAPFTLPLATPCKGRGAGTLSRLVCADAWWRHPIGQDQIPRGDLVEVFPMTSAPVAFKVAE